MPGSKEGDIQQSVFGFDDEMAITGAGKRGRGHPIANLSSPVQMGGPASERLMP